MGDRKRKWIVSNERDEYLNGVEEFLEYAFRGNGDGKVPCPCRKCLNRFHKSKTEIYDHLVIHRMVEDYDTWYAHGESLSTSFSKSDVNADQGTSCHNNNDDGEDIMEMLCDAFGVSTQAQVESSDEDIPIEPNLDGNDTQNFSAHPEPNVNKFTDLLKEADKELYPGCNKFSRLSFVLHLYHIKIRFGWSNKSFDVLLKLLTDAFPEGHTLPDSERESHKMVEGLGLKYEKIDACPNDCMLFWKDKIDAQKFSKCLASRWKVDKNASVSNRKKKPIPAKVLRYFPLTPRLQRLFVSSKTASDMTWHETKRKRDEGVMRHPADSEDWRNFSTHYPDFANEPRNVRLGLASDGFNPFSKLDSRYSIWPVILIPYNVPPWLCMKRENFILSMIIPGPRAPGNDIDVYFQPLIEELKDLWENGVATYDASSEQVFQMHVALNWTINDLPALGNLSGWNIYSEHGCPSCQMNTCALRLKHGGKVCFMGHQRFLDDRNASRTPSGLEVLEQVKHIQFSLGKLSGPPTGVLENTWKKRSIFFELPYWQHNGLRHNFDVMHIEKNVADNLHFTVSNTAPKSKDNLKARRDLKAALP